MLRSIITTALALAVTVTGAMPAVANPYNTQEGNSVQDHIALVEALNEVGIPVYFNTKECKPNAVGVGKPAGFYRPDQNVMTICQDNGAYDQVVVNPTYNDLDTIRHESQHVIQDCLAGLVNSRMENMFPVETTEAGQMTLDEFVEATGYPQEALDVIAQDYTKMGYPPHYILLEFEAWSAAYAVPANTIALGVREACSVRTAR